MNNRRIKIAVERVIVGIQSMIFSMAKVGSEEKLGVPFVMKDIMMLKQCSSDDWCFPIFIKVIQSSFPKWTNYKE